MTEQSSGLEGVSETVWQFQLGVHQVCEKWLKDRKGRRFEKEYIEKYTRIVTAVSEMIRLMKQIDQRIEQCGGIGSAERVEG